MSWLRAVPPRWDAPCGGDPLRPLDGDLTGYTTDECFAPRKRPKLRCRLFGCKHIDDATLHWGQRNWCEVHNLPFYNVDDGTMFGRDVHAGCCVRCGNPIFPRARALKGSP